MFEHSFNGSILRVKDLSLAFGESVILKGVNFEIKNVVRPGMEQGQVLAILGPSGVGKTQIFRAIAGLDIPTATMGGSITIGEERQVPVTPGLVGVVSQHYPLFMHRKVLDNLVLPGMRAGLSKAAAKDKAMKLLDEFGLHDRYDHWPAQLSGGQRQRVAIAQQLMCSEHLVLMDEPFSGLDPVMKEKVIGLIRSVTKMNEYNTMVVVTHEISAAVAIADHIIMIGRDRDKEGALIPGAYVKYEFNLIERGLAWQSDIRKMPEFGSFCAELYDLFNEL